MSDSEPAPRAAMPPADRVVDGLDLWETEADHGHAAPLSAVRLDGNARMLVPFTTIMVRATLHYVEHTSLRSYVHCNGAHCLLCRVGRQQDVRDLWPVYDVLAGAVAVLPISPSLRPHALRPLLKPVLHQVKEGKERFFIEVWKPDSYKFTVGTFPLPADADDGAAAIKAFQEKFDAGLVDLGSVYPRITNEDLAMYPEVATAMQMKGIGLS